MAIWDQIAKHNPQAAERGVMAAFEDTIEQLAGFARLGTAGSHLAPDRRRMPWRRYLIFCRRLRGDLVELGRVLYGRPQVTPASFA